MGNFDCLKLPRPIEKKVALPTNQIPEMLGYFLNLNTMKTKRL